MTRTHSERLTGGQALMKTLLALGAKRGFGVPGESYLEVLDAMFDAPDFAFTVTRNEGGAAFMAEAWARLTGQVGLCFVTRGPGATNASIGVHTAMQGSTPMILFVGQVGLDHQGYEAFQEVDYRQMFAPLAKHTIEIADPARVPETVLKAWTLAQSGRPGPVVVALPEDMLRAEADVIIPQGPIHVDQAAPTDRSVDAIGDLLRTSKRPVLLVGGAGFDGPAKAALAAFQSKTGIPVVCAFRYHWVFDNTHPGFVGEAGVGMTPNTRRVLQQADLIIAAGTRFGEMTTDAFTLFGPDRGEQKIVHAHPSADEFGKVVQADLAVQSHTGPFFAALAKAGQGAPHLDQTWANLARDGYIQSQQAPPQPGDLDMGQVTLHVRNAMDSNAIVTSGAGNFAIWTNKFISYGPDQILLAPQSGAMGYGLPAAVAAKIEHPDRQVICYCGDGDFQMNCQELGTAMQAGAGPVILVVNNGTYGTIRMHQEKHHPKRVSGTDLKNPDFAAMAQAYGMFGAQVTRTQDFAAAFAQALADPRGAVIDLVVDQSAITPRLTIKQLQNSSR